jgi:hypothetical protein
MPVEDGASGGGWVAVEPVSGGGMMHWRSIGLLWWG